MLRDNIDDENDDNVVYAAGTASFDAQRKWLLVIPRGFKGLFLLMLRLLVIPRGFKPHHNL